MVDLELKIGQTVRTNEGRLGTIRYIGGLHIAPGNWLGLELPDASGKNDGSVKGERYFNCKPGYGIFIRDGAAVEVVKQPTIAATPKPNGNATVPNAGPRARPSSGITADVARKRQSLMSNGSGSATGSRLSVRSPTKSPTKPTNTSTSSTTSTPRAGTPSAAARPADVHKSRLSISSRTSMGPQSGTVRPATHTSRPSISGASTLRSSLTNRTAAPLSKPSTSAARLPQTARSVPRQEKPVAKQFVKPRAEREGDTRVVRSPMIDEEIEDDHVENGMPSIDHTINQQIQDDDHESPSESKDVHSPSTSPKITKTMPGSRVGSSGNVEIRTAQQREIEQLKAKIRTLEKKRQEDRDKLKQVETLQSDKDRFEGIIQALQKKLRMNQQELVDTRNKYEEAEARANAIPERAGEHESELELATLDKEMAEERAETFQLELEALKAKHEELELEVEILREENTELASTMSPEEKASAGWLQMERERERLRDALLRLRDMSQDNESSLKAEIDELRETLDEAEKTAGMYAEAAAKLARAEETTKHLMGQLEAVDTNDEIVEALEIQREEHLDSIQQLRNQIQDLEEHIQVTDELELFHVDEEKRLHNQLDENEALLSESHRRNTEQDRVIEDLEYTLTKFRDVVQGLQSDIDDLRRSRDISESQANEMSSKSRAMMDLNLRLQNNAAKTQTKFIDTELNKVKAELAGKHADILTLFTPESFETERGPILALLCLGRTRLKASLVSTLLSERLRERSHLSNGEEVFASFETMEHMEWISKTCGWLEKYMDSCGTQEFAACGIALAEVEPVERTVTGWLDALRRDELASTDPEHLRRMHSVLLDLSEKLITESPESKAMQIVVQMGLVENYAESLTSQFIAMNRLVQSKLGAPQSEDEESLAFDKKMDQLATKARTIKYLSSKVVQQLNELYKSSLCLGEASWLLFDEAEDFAAALARQIRVTGFTVAEELSKLDPEAPVTYTSISNKMAFALQESSQSNGEVGVDPFTIVSAHLASLQSLVDALQSKSTDLNGTLEFEVRPAPWLVRAKEIKNTKIISPEVQEDLNRLERRNTELGAKIAERERTIEEMGMRVEIAEKRFKESKEKDKKDKALQEELNWLKLEQRTNGETIAALRNDLAAATQNAESTQLELETIRKATNGDTMDANSTTAADAGMGIMDEGLVKRYDLEVSLLQADILSLQSTIRYLRDENRTLRIPVSEVLIDSARHSWLDGSIATRKKLALSKTPSDIHSKPNTHLKLRQEGLDVYADLINVAASMKPIRLSSSATPHRPIAQTSRYTVLQQRESLERWEAWRNDLLSRAKIASVGTRRAKTQTKLKAGLRDPVLTGVGVPRADGSNLHLSSKRPADIGAIKDSVDSFERENEVGHVKIVEM